MDRDSDDDLFGSESEDDVVQEVQELERQQAVKKQSLLEKVLQVQNESDQDESIDSKEESEHGSETGSVVSETGDISDHDDDSNESIDVHEIHDRNLKVEKTYFLGEKVLSIATETMTEEEKKEYYKIIAFHKRRFNLRTKVIPKRFETVKMKSIEKMRKEKRGFVDYATYYDFNGKKTKTQISMYNEKESCYVALNILSC